MFGQTGNTSFSGFSTGTQNSLFGQSAFGKPITTTSFGSGATPVFGSSNTSLFSSKPTGSTTGGLFGNTTTPPAFRQPTNTQPSFGGFGTTNTSTNLFGTQQNTGTNLFGTSTGTSAFGQANKPGFNFGTTSGTNLFGQTQQNAQQTTPFGQTNTTNTNLFGTTTNFGNTNPTTVPAGTAVKFTPVITTDSMSKNGISHSISARHCCIASMKEYENKSYEELRFEDYQLGRKGPQTGLFGTSTQTSPFGGTTAGTSTGGTGFGSMTGGFGATNQSGSTGLFGKPISNFGSSATTTTNSFVFNSPPTTNLFGTNTQTKPFGTAPTPLFGTPSTNQTAGTGFGNINTTQNTGFGSAFGSTQPNQSIGLFNQNKSAFNIPSTSTSTGFTGFGQPATNTTTLFGNKTTTTGFGGTSTFGATAPSTFGTNTGFNTGSNAGSSLFNSSFKPAGQTPAFSFGTTPVSSTGLGTNTGLSLGGNSSLFGQQKPGSLFGNTGNNTTFNNPGSFGPSTFGTSSNMISGTGIGLLNGGMTSNQAKTNGSVPVHQQILALVSAPFGDSPLLKNLLPASGKTEELLKPTNPASKVLNSPQYRVTANNKSPKIKARVVSSSQLSKKSLFDGLEEEDPVITEAFQPRPSAKRLVLRPKSTINSLVQSPTENGESVTRNGTIDGADISNAMHSNNIEVNDKENHSQDNNRLANDRRSSTSWLKSTLPRKNKILDDELLEGQRSPFSGTNVPEEVNNTVAELRSQNNISNHSETINSIEMPLNSTFDEKNSANLTIPNAESGQETDEGSFSMLQSNWSMNMAKVTLRRVGYYTIPPLDKLDDFVCGETCIVPNFTIGREGYGNVYFPDSFDVYGLNLDEIVHFRHKEVIIYPDDEKKPPVGQGLNRKAQVTLDKVWPHDKSLHEPITDPQRLAAMNYEGKLRRVSAKHDTRFLEYRPETGSWVFKVDHFSKYGLSDSDEDDSQVSPTSDAKKLKGFSASVQKSKPVDPSATMNKAINGTINGTFDGTKIGNGKQLSMAESNFLGKTPINRFGYSDHSCEERGMIVSSVREIPFGCSDFISGDYSYEKRMTVSPVGDSARVAGTDSHKLQLMKASFFNANDEDVNEEPSNGIFPSVQKTLIRYFSNVTEAKSNQEALYTTTALRTTFVANETLFSTPLSENVALCASSSRRSHLSHIGVRDKQSIIEKAILPPIITPVTSVLKYHYEVVPLKESRLNRLRFRCVADAGIYMGRTFRPSWGTGLTLLSLSTQEQATKMQLRSAFSQLSRYVSGRLADDVSSTVIVQRLQILGGDEYDARTFSDSIERHLRIQLDHCVMGHEGDCPTFDVATDSANEALQLHCTLAQDLAEKEQRPCENTNDEQIQSGASERSFRQYANIVWALCIALWGSYANQDTFNNANEEHYNVMVRREAVGEWLRNVVQRTVEREIKSIDGEAKNSHEKMILSLLSAYKLEDACQEARKAGDHCLALLMAQLRSGATVKKLIKQQLALWQETDVDENLTIDRLKLFMLVAGEPLISSKHGTINVCEYLDWKRAFAIHLWYLSSPTCSITDALDLYEASFNTTEAQAYAAVPEPEYRQNDYDAELSNGKRIHDLCFHLLKLYCTGNHDLGELLNPLTYTANPLDYRLSWLMQQTLVALGYTHLSDHVAALTHTNFATQLEAHGLWHWAIFVVLHLRDSSRRRTAVQDLLLRHIEIDNTPEYVKREQFLKEELGISSIWIHQAKAIKSSINKRYGEAAWYYIQAEQWTQAHEIIIEHLAADAVINENYEYLKSLLSSLVAAECSGTISGWSHQGQLLWEYMEITSEIQDLLKSAPDYCGLTYQLEALKPRLTAVCQKIDQFPCLTAKHRLCQAEIAKRTLHLARNMLLLQENEQRSITKLLVRLISQLPLPEDYAQQELRPIVNMRVAEIMP
ncbi:nuclear pore complex protein Nup98-Nup96 isoform X2 [Monomorium pharaonis]|uniref:nuclear pore complex protein Nup98-Nup96 isoform X2 n=1 Tax=Monomorium pharaonis TaxID=307658 RepID=UPI00063F5F1C|nr:nuclear pore complex protein Nup98-Nup96 isoform X2 [Monomorium pharaonis]